MGKLGPVPGTNGTKWRFDCGIKQKSAVKQRGRERKGPPEIIQEFRLKNWPISSAVFPMTPMEGTEHHFGPF